MPMSNLKERSPSRVMQRQVTACFRHLTRISGTRKGKSRRKRVQIGIRQLVLLVMAVSLIVAADGAAAAAKKKKKAQSYPYSIITPEPGTKQSKLRKRGKPAVQGEQAAPVKRGKRRIGSGSLRLPPYRSPLTPLGTAPRVIETPAAAQIPAAPMPVPGFPVVPPPPAALGGQSFPDKAIGCVQHGTSSGVGVGDIGAYTQSCVNTR
jgi:hypothetical protein